MSTTGLSSASGTIDDPTDLSSAFYKIADGGTIYILSGTYIGNGFSFGIGRRVNILALAGMAMFTGEDGYPPGIVIGQNTNIYGVWFGGSRVLSAESGRIVTLNIGSKIEGCTFFGYGQTISGEVGNKNITTKNRFVNCGFGSSYHDIYVSDSAASDGVISENIHIGGAGYKIQLYHNPTGVLIHANFMAGSACGDMAIQNGDDVVTNNILWGPSNQYWNAENCLFNKNIFGVDRQAFYDVTLENNTADGNVFCNGQTLFGTNAATWDTAAIASNLGHTKAAIDTAISNLITKFGQTTAQIYADATIETDFQVLRDVIDAWRNV